MDKERIVRCSGLLLLGLLAACGQREATTTSSPEPAAGDAAVAVPEPAASGVQDVAEHDQTRTIGITFPPDVGRMPGLATLLGNYAAAARADLDKAVAELGTEKPRVPYELSLDFRKTVDTPVTVAVSADGSLYTGGAHGMPLVARFVWLPARNEALTADHLLADAAGWKAVSAYVRDQLRKQAVERLDASQGLSAQDRAELLKSGAQMIDDGTGPEPANFAQFEPVPGAQGRIAALRFVFPPYQVGPYSDGTQTVEVPASVLLPHVAAAYRELFAQ